MTPSLVEKNNDSRGLAGQTVGETKICSVNQTQLIYRGYEIADLAENACFEEVAYLLLVGHKPTVAELDAFKKKCLMEGLDDIALSMEKISKIDNFESKIQEQKPWLLQND